MGLVSMHNVYNISGAQICPFDHGVCDEVKEYFIPFRILLRETTLLKVLAVVLICDCLRLVLKLVSLLYK